MIVLLVLVLAVNTASIELDHELRFHCFSEAVKDFHRYKETEGEAKLKSRAAKAGASWNDYQNTFASALATMCYEQHINPVNHSRHQ